MIKYSQTRKNTSKTTKKNSKALTKTKNINANTNTKPKHIYTIIDNGTLPYIIHDHGNKVIIYGNKYDRETKKFIITGKLLEIQYKQIFVGYDEDYNTNKQKKDYGVGNTILLRTGTDKYILIADGIREFTLKNGDIIKEYHSPIGNNDIPYQFAVGDKYVYFLLEDDMKYAQKDKIDLTRSHEVFNQYSKIGDYQDYDIGSTHKLKTKKILKRFAHFKS
jgi:hypothetical protein